MGPRFRHSGPFAESFLPKLAKLTNGSPTHTAQTLDSSKDKTSRAVNPRASNKPSIQQCLNSCRKISQVIQPSTCRRELSTQSQPWSQLCLSIYKAGFFGPLPSPRVARPQYCDVAKIARSIEEWLLLIPVGVGERGARAGEP